jgi:hypothetical protein
MLTTWPSRVTRAAKSAAARIGPTVCELEGPIPMVKSWNMLNCEGRPASCWKAMFC